MNKLFYVILFGLISCSSGNTNLVTISESTTDLAKQTLPLLTPENGGKSIDGRSLQKGDVIFSTTDNPLSWLIRTQTGNGPVSHVSIVSDKIGDAVFIVQAIGTGVEQISLDDFLNENTFAVAFRYRQINNSQTSLIADYLKERQGAQYDLFGAMTAASPIFLFHDDKVEVDYGQFKSKKTYCSKLMLEAYQSAGIDLTKISGNWSPNGLVNLALLDMLQYVGHLKYP